MIDYKLFPIIVVSLFFTVSLFATPVFALTDAGILTQGQACDPNDNLCSPSLGLTCSSQTDTCVTAAPVATPTASTPVPSAATPTLPPSVTADGTVPPGGACTSDVNCEGDNYGCYPEGNGTCTLNGDAPITSPVATPAANTQTTASNGIINPLNATSIGGLLLEVLGYVTQIGAVFLVLMLVFVGFQFVAARGNPEAVGKARTALLWTVIGGLILLGAQAIAIVIVSTVASL